MGRRVEHVKQAVVLNDTARMQSAVITTGGRIGMERLGEGLPGDQIGRARLADGAELPRVGGVLEVIELHERRLDGRSVAEKPAVLELGVLRFVRHGVLLGVSGFC